jgi:hypothetical protein
VPGEPCGLHRLPHQRSADRLRAELRPDGERSEQQRRRLADGDRRQPHRADEGAADQRDEGQRRFVRHALAQAVGRAGKAAGSEDGGGKVFDGGIVAGKLRPIADVHLVAVREREKDRPVTRPPAAWLSGGVGTTGAWQVQRPEAAVAPSSSQDQTEHRSSHVSGRRIAHRRRPG